MPDLTSLKRIWESDPENQQSLASYVFALQRAGKKKEIAEILAQLILYHAEAMSPVFRFPDSLGRPDGLIITLRFYPSGSNYYRRGRIYFDSPEDQPRSRLGVKICLASGLDKIYYNSFVYPRDSSCKKFFILDEDLSDTENITISVSHILGDFYIPILEAANWIEYLKKIRVYNDPEAAYQYIKSQDSRRAYEILCSVPAPLQKEGLVCLNRSKKFRTNYIDQPSNASGKAFSSWAIRKMKAALFCSQISGQSVVLNTPAWDTGDDSHWDFSWREMTQFSATRLYNISSSRSDNIASQLTLTAFYPTLMWSTEPLTIQLNNATSFRNDIVEKYITTNGLFYIQRAARMISSLEDIVVFIKKLLELNFPGCEIVIL